MVNTLWDEHQSSRADKLEELCYRSNLFSQVSPVSCSRDTCGYCRYKY